MKKGQSYSQQTLHEAHTFSGHSCLPFLAGTAQLTPTWEGTPGVGQEGSGAALPIPPAERPWPRMPAPLGPRHWDPAICTLPLPAAPERRPDSLWRGGLWGTLTWLVTGNAVFARGKGNSISPRFPVSSPTGQALHLPGPLVFKEIKVRSGC